MTLKDDIADLLGSKFGKETAKLVEKNYSDKNPQEIYDVAEHMLSAFMGKKAADATLEKLLSKYGKLNIKKAKGAN
ncbi:MAG: hypothetical protein JW789_00030 [Candidatus Aenigmarchaeota archaeon]|nr:hypothetical protein [Candidatus Aenigmarchaeota archaeon]